MSNISLAALTTTQLRRAIAIKERLTALESELNGLLGSTQAGIARRGRRTSGSRRRKSGTEKGENVVTRQEAAAEKAPVRKRRKISAAGRAKMRAAAKARWAAAKTKGQNKL